jgi:hypothetical protein
MQQGEDMARSGDADTANDAVRSTSPPAAAASAAEQRHARALPQGGAGCDGRGDDERWQGWLMMTDDGS